jgi:1,4-dihydroxy-2-naphthoate octaprenyltransferase
VPFLGGFIEVSRTMRNKLTVMLYFVSGILFFISALSKNYVFIPIGLLFAVLGIKYNNKKVNNKGDKYL